MAQRRLKFKPKPVVGGSLRRPREDEESLKLKLEMKNETPDSVIVSNADDEEIVLKKSKKQHELDKNFSSEDNSINNINNLNGCPETKSIHHLTSLENNLEKTSNLNVNITSQEIPPPTQSSENWVTESNTFGLTSSSSENIQNSQSVSVNNNLSHCHQSVNQMSQSSSPDSLNSTQEILTKLIIDKSDRRSKLLETQDFDSADSVINSQGSIESSLNNDIDSISNSSISQETTETKKSHTKSDFSDSQGSLFSKGDNTVKAPTRLGRSKFKPVLNNVCQRKKIETIQTTVENVSISSVQNIRTESVIKCVKSELVKTNSIATEIIEGFTALESEDIIPPKCYTHNVTKNGVNGIQEINEFNDKCAQLNTKSASSSETNHDLSLNLQSVKLSMSNNIQLSNCVNLVSREQSDSDKSVEVVGDRENTENSNSSTHNRTPVKVPVSPLKSTSKILIPKPCPNLLDTTVRRISFQGSDSEDEAKRKNSSTSNELLKTEGLKNTEKNIKTNKRKRSQGSTYSKMGQDTLQKFSEKFGKGKPPDKTKLTMLDLIFYNPATNPMSLNTQPSTTLRKKEEQIDENNDIVKETLAEESVDDVEAPAIPVPQLTVGPDGQVMLDPKSLVIEMTDVKKNREEMEKSEVIRETGITRYSTYSKKKNSRRDWTAQETLQFYKALNTIGSDFTLMSKLFPNRTRHDLKLKFKREERMNMKLVDKAMTAPGDFDFSGLEEEMKRENEELAKQAMEKKNAAEAAKREREIRKGLKKKSKIKYVPSNFHARGSAILEFDESEITTLKSNIKPKYTRKKTKMDSGEDELQMNIGSSDDISMLVLKTVEKRLKPNKRGMRRNRKLRLKKLKECEEINETLKKKLEEDSDSEDGYKPNGPSADMLFGSPNRDPSQAPEGNWTMEIASVPDIEDTVLLNNDVEEVSELSELGSFGQNDTVLDLSLPIRANINPHNSQVPVSSDLVLNRHLISQSIHIIDQLTSDENLKEDSVNEVKVDFKERPTKQELIDKLPLPSFESVSFRPSVVYSLGTPYDDVETDQQDNMSEGNNTTGVIISNYYDTEEECILGN